MSIKAYKYKPTSENSNALLLWKKKNVHGNAGKKLVLTLWPKICFNEQINCSMLKNKVVDMGTQGRLLVIPGGITRPNMWEYLWMSVEIRMLLTSNYLTVYNIYSINMFWGKDSWGLEILRWSVKNVQTDTFYKHTFIAFTYVHNIFIYCFESVQNLIFRASFFTFPWMFLKDLLNLTWCWLFEHESPEGVSPHIINSWIYNRCLIVRNQ